MGLWALQRQEEPIHSEHFLDATVIGLLLDQGGSVPRAVAATGELGSVSPKANNVTGMCFQASARGHSVPGFLQLTA